MVDIILCEIALTFIYRDR